MGANSKIEWTDHTFNPWVGCTKVGPPCDNCYAESWAKRSGMVQWGDHPRVRTSAANWRQPLKWAWAAKMTGSRPRVFCASLADVFDNQVPREWRHDLWSLILHTPELDWLLLTKRPQNIKKMLPECWGIHGFYANVWLGITCGDQTEFDRDWPKLRAVDAAVRFISYEPALGPLRLYETPSIPLPHPFPDWIIAGGESGGKARPSHPQWFRELRDDCAHLSIAYLFKQWGEWDEYTRRVGKKAAGRLLDGREHNGFPVQRRLAEAA
jgi:protein gp37